MAKQTLAVAWKELQVLFRDRGQLAVLFLMPLMFGTIIGSMNSGDTPGIDVHLVNEDGGPYGAQLAQTLHDIEALRIEELDTVEQADARVADGEVLAAIIIPAGFSETIDAFEPASVVVIVDPAQQKYGSIVTGIVNEAITPITYRGEIQHGIQTVMDESGSYNEANPQIRAAVAAQTLGVIMTQLAEMFENPQISVIAQDLEGVETRQLDSAFSYTMPSYAVMFAFFIIGTIAGTMLQEKEEGTFRRLLAAPIHRGAIIAGKMLAYMLVVALQVLVVLGVGRIAFGMPLGDAPLGLVLVTFALAFAATAVGMLVAALARTRSQAEGIAFVIAMVLALVGGSIMMLPEEGFLHSISQFTPHAHAIEGYLKLTSEGAGVIDVLPQVGLLAAVGTVIFLIAMWRFRFE